MSGERKTRTHDRAFKLAVLALLVAGETVSTLSRQVGREGGQISPGWPRDAPIVRQGPDR